MAAITYRKTRAGEWVACGPAAVIQAAAGNGTWITIAKKNGGTDKAVLSRAGRAFTAGGTEMAYGYIRTSGPERRSRRDDLAEYGDGFSPEERAAFGAAR